MKGRLPPGFHRLLAARVLSVFGDLVLPVAVAFAVLSTLHAGPGAVGIVLGAEFLGMLGFLLFGGVLADRLPPVFTLVASDVVRAVIQLAAALMLVTGTMSVPVFAVMLMIRGAASAFFSPAFGPLLLDIVGSARIQEASGKLGSAVSAAIVLAPMAGGGLVVWIGPAGGIAVDGLSFVASALLLVGLRRTGAEPAAPNRPAKGSMMRELRAGAQVVLSRPWLWGSAAVAAMVELFASGPWSAIVPVVANTRYGGATGYSWLLTALGVGAVAGGAIAARLPVQRHVLTAHLMLIPLGLSSLALALHAPLWVVIGAFVVCGASQGVFGALWRTALSRAVPRAVLGRVNSWDTLGSFACRPVGQSAGGLVAARFGPDIVLWVSTGVVVLAPLCLVASAQARRRTADLELSIAVPATTQVRSG